MADYPYAVTEHPDHADDGHLQHAVHHLVLELLEPLGDFLLDEESSHVVGVGSHERLRVAHRI